MIEFLQNVNTHAALIFAVLVLFSGLLIYGAVIATAEGDQE